MKARDCDEDITVKGGNWAGTNGTETMLEFCPETPSWSVSVSQSLAPSAIYNEEERVIVEGLNHCVSRNPKYVTDGWLFSPLVKQHRRLGRSFNKAHQQREIKTAAKRLVKLSRTINTTQTVRARKFCKRQNFPQNHTQPTQLGI